MMTKYLFRDGLGYFLDPCEEPADWDEILEGEELDWEEPNSEEKEDIFF